MVKGYMDICPATVPQWYPRSPSGCGGHCGSFITMLPGRGEQSRGHLKHRMCWIIYRRGGGRVKNRGILYKVLSVWCFPWHQSRSVDTKKQIFRLRSKSAPSTDNATNYYPRIVSRPRANIGAKLSERPSAFFRAKCGEGE